MSTPDERKTANLADGPQGLHTEGERSEPRCACGISWKAAVFVLLAATAGAVLMHKTSGVPAEPAQQTAVVAGNADSIERQETSAAANPLDEALRMGRPVLADFGRGKCIPCKAMRPILDDLKGKYNGKAEVLIIDIDQYPVLTRRCGIRAIPTQIFYGADGKEVYRHQGFMPREDIVTQLRKLGAE